MTTEAKYHINCTQSGKRFVLSLHYNGNSSLFFVNATKIFQFKTVVCYLLGNISKNFTINILKKKTGLKGIVFFFFFFFYC